MNVNLIEYLNCFEIKNFNDVLFYYIDRVVIAILKSIGV